VKRLTARLAVFADGRPRGRTRIDCTWPAPAGNLDGRLTLLVEDGRAFGAAGKRVPNLGLSFAGDEPTTRSTTRRDAPPVENPGGRQSMTALPGPVAAREVLYAEVAGPPYGPFGPFESDDEFVRASAGGRVVVAVILEWAPDGPAAAVPEPPGP
jgi:hypothetical protein